MRELNPSAAGLSVDDICAWLVTEPRRAYAHLVRPNVLIIGPVAKTEATVSAIVAALKRPAHFWAPDMPPPRGADDSAIVIRDVATLSSALQEAWLVWLNAGRRRHRQIIATSSMAVFPLVTQGMFVEGLYYRLNTVLLDLRSPTDHE